MRAYEVLLNDVSVGTLSEGPGASVAFRFSSDYARLPNRPILSQSFEDDLGKNYSSKRGKLPPYFLNIIPEGTALRQLIEQSLGVEADDDLALVSAVGEDLPGAVRIRLQEGLPFHDDDTEAEDGFESTDDEPKFRFSLAGVQLKFSLLREDEKLVLPAHGASGEWIVKLPSTRFPLLPQNEFATLTWAQECGFDVPEFRLQTPDELPERVSKHLTLQEPSLAIRRFDRADTGRIHQEDFAQVIGAPPNLKYQFTYEKCALLISQICGLDDYFQFVKRLAFAIVSGNFDAHLKNWSLIYRNGTDASLTPLYDQVVICAYPEVNSELALKFCGTRAISNVGEQQFEQLAKVAQQDPMPTLDAARETIEIAIRQWKMGSAKGLLPIAHCKALEAYWKKVPLLRHYL